MSIASHKQTGNKGEALAVQFIERKGYHIIATNWQSKHLEIDIVARDGNTLVFVEVKTRANDLYGLPEEGVSPEKEERLQRAAEAYLEESGWEGPIRFDIVAIVVGKEPFHLEDAFFPGDW